MQRVSMQMQMWKINKQTTSTTFQFVLSYLPFKLFISMGEGQNQQQQHQIT